MSIEVIVVMITTAKVPIVVIVYKLSIMIATTRRISSAGDVVVPRDSSTFVMGAALHSVVAAIAIARSHAAAVATTTLAATITTASGHMATVATTTLAATITTAMLDKRDHISGSKGIQDARRTCRLSRLPRQC